MMVEDNGVVLPVEPTETQPLPGPEAAAVGIAEKGLRPEGDVAGALVTLAREDPDDFERSGLSFDSINRNILRLVDAVKAGGENSLKAKDILGELLRAREDYYYQVAVVLNSDIRRVEGRVGVYSIGGREMFGSVVAALDATESLTSNEGLINALRMPKSNSVEVVEGETLLPKSMMEVAMVLSGSTAQDRTQRYGADIDGAEHVMITAESREVAAGLLAEAIRASVHDSLSLDVGDSLLQLHFLELKVGGNIPDSAVFHSDGSPIVDRKLRWSVGDIEQGYKKYLSNSGEEVIVSLTEACNDPRMLKVDYVGVSDTSVFEVTKVTTVIAKDTEGNIMFSNDPGRATAFQEIYFDDPTIFGLIEATYDPDRFITYIDFCRKDIKEYSEPAHANKLKVLKRLHNLSKVVGDIETVRQLEGAFRSDAARLYQLVDRIAFADLASDKGVDVVRQKAVMFQTLNEMDISRNLPGISKGENGEVVDVDMDVFREAAMKAINDIIDVYIRDNPRILSLIEEIMAQ